MKKCICDICGKELHPLGVARHKRMHADDSKMLARFNKQFEVDYLKELMKDGWCRRDIKDAYNINDRVLNIILSRK